MGGSDEASAQTLMPMFHFIFHNLRKPIAFVLSGLLFIPLGLRANDAGRAPSAAPSDIRPQRADGRSGEIRGDQTTPDANDSNARTRPVRKPGAEEIIISAAEWTELERFMQAHSPRKWQMYVSLSDEPLKQTLGKQIAQRYRGLQRVEKTDPARWNMEIEAIGIEDVIYTILQELRMGNDVAANEQQLRIEVDRLISNRDDWRRERLLRVKAELESLKLSASLGPVEAELERLGNITPEARATRVDKRIEDFKRQMDKPPRALLGGRSPASEVPGESADSRR